MSSMTPFESFTRLAAEAKHKENRTNRPHGQAFQDGQDFRGPEARE